MKAKEKLGRRALFLVTVATMIGASVGFVFAAGFTVTSVNETAQWYQVSNGAVPAFPTQPSVQIATVPAGVASCSPGTVTFSSGTTLNVYLNSRTGSNSCSAGDFAELFTLTSANNAPVGNYTMEAFTTYGSPSTTGANSVVIQITSAFVTATTLNIYVDYRSATPPTGGITDLELIVQ